VKRTNVSIMVDKIQNGILNVCAALQRLRKADALLCQRHAARQLLQRPSSYRTPNTTHKLATDTKVHRRRILTIISAAMTQRVDCCGLLALWRVLHVAIVLEFRTDAILGAQCHSVQSCKVRVLSVCG
jgi:hypothetical protein